MLNVYSKSNSKDFFSLFFVIFYRKFNSFLKLFSNFFLFYCYINFNRTSLLNKMKGFTLRHAQPQPGGLLSVEKKL